MEQCDGCPETSYRGGRECWGRCDERGLEITVGPDVHAPAGSHTPKRPYLTLVPPRLRRLPGLAPGNKRAAEAQQTCRFPPANTPEILEMYRI